MHILRKHKVSPPALDAWQLPVLGGRNEQLLTPIPQENGVPPFSMDLPMFGSIAGTNPLLPEILPNDQGPLSYFNEMSQTFDAQTNFASYDWNAIFSDLDASFI